MCNLTYLFLKNVNDNNIKWDTNVQIEQNGTNNNECVLQSAILPFAFYVNHIRCGRSESDLRRLAVAGVPFVGVNTTANSISSCHDTLSGQLRRSCRKSKIIETGRIFLRIHSQLHILLVSLSEVSIVTAHMVVPLLFVSLTVFDRAIFGACRLTDGQSSVHNSKVISKKLRTPE